MHDLVIRNGKIVDGTGQPARVGDIAVDGGAIAAAGGKAGPGRREINADGLLVTPGWVDIHSHYDGQVAWDPYVSPSSWHGVTTVIMGNCGVGFAPVKRGSEEFLLNLMDGVEDIPTATLAAGINFEWETFGEYLDALSRMKRAIDIGAQVPHCAVRVYAMGERGAANEEATPEDIARIAAAVREGARAGALGASTSRTLVHRTRAGELVPGTFAGIEEVLAIGRALGEVGHGVFEVISDMTGPDQSMEWMIQLTKETGLPISLAALGNGPTGPGIRRRLDFMKQANAAGARLVSQLAVRSPGQLMGLETSSNPLIGLPSYDAIAHLPLSERVARMRDPQLRARIIAEMPDKDSNHFNVPTDGWANLFPLGDPPNYEPAREMSLEERAKREGITPQAAYYDTMLERDGRELVYRPFNYTRSYSLDPLLDLLLDPVNIISLSDGGAHCAEICDASAPTFLLEYWVRDRSRNGRIPLEFAVKRQTRETAELYGLNDRGALLPGLKADINLIDFERLASRPPEIVFDFPANGARFVQRAQGYKYTIVSGEVVFTDGNPTGAMPGKVVRGGRTAAN
ncbi:MAG TPA: amidohydrolase family protein [Candidatus Binataceae bacterium]|nr:amidohydrolase family protein [Candidatus Binataceae bacterium]